MKCSYCKENAIGYDAIGLEACNAHLSEADEHVDKHSSRKDARNNGENIYPINTFKELPENRCQNCGDEIPDNGDTVCDKCAYQIQLDIAAGYQRWEAEEARRAWLREDDNP